MSAIPIRPGALSVLALGVVLHEARDVSEAGVPIFGDLASPRVWADGGRSIGYVTDLGGLAMLTHEEAVAMTRDAFRAWEDVPSATPTFVDTGSLPVDIDETNYEDILLSEPDGIVAVIFNEDGTIPVQGSGLGLTILDVDATGIVDATIFLGGELLTQDFPVEDLRGIVVHEIGHVLGLAHSVVNCDVFAFNDHTGPSPHDTYARPASPDGIIETMCGFFIEETRGGGQATLHADDISIISALYPEPDFHASTFTIKGRILSRVGEPLTNLNVIARSLDDPANEAVSAVSGFGGTGAGSFALPGLKPGARYAVYVDNSTFSAGFPGREEFYNGAAESSDPATDEESELEPLIAEAGTVLSGIDIRFNEIDPGTLSLAARHSVGIPLPFSVDLCGDTFDSIIIGGGGQLEFGRHFNSFYGTAGDLLGSGVPVIVSLSAGFLPELGGVIAFDRTAENFTVTFTDVPTFDGSVARPNTFATTLLAREGTEPNRVIISYGELGTEGGLAGFSCGARWTTGLEEEADLGELSGAKIDTDGVASLYEVFDDGDNDLDGVTIGFTLPTAAEDELERNDARELALPVNLPFNTIDRSTLLAPGDIDHYRVKARAGEILLAERLFFHASPLHTILGLFDEEGTLIASSDTGAYPISRLICAVPEDGKYVLAITTVPDTGFTGDGAGRGRYLLGARTYRGAALPLGASGSIEVPLPFDFPFQGRRWSSVFVNGNGNMTFGAPDPLGAFDLREGPGSFLEGPPRIAPFFTGLDPSGGLVAVEEDAGEWTVHWISVPLSSSPWSNSFSTKLHRDGRIVMSWDAVSRFPGALVGITEGGGAGDPGPSDLSELGTVTPSGTTYEVFGRRDRPFDLLYEEIRWREVDLERLRVLQTEALGTRSR